MTAEGERTAEAERVLRSLPKRLRIAAVGQATALVALLLWVFWADPGQRYLLLMGCLGIAAAVVLLLARAGRTHGRLSPVEAARAVLGPPAASGSPAPLPATLPRDVRGRLWACAAKLCVLGWGLGFLLLIIGSPVPPAQVREIREAGGVVTEARVVGTAGHEFHGPRKGKYANDPKAKSMSVRLDVEVPDADGRPERVSTGRTTFARLRPNDGTLQVIYAPGALHLGAYVGSDSRRPNDSEQNHLGPFTGYQDDLERILAGRTLSGYQMGIAGVLGTLLLIVAAWPLLLGWSRPRGRLPAGSRALYGTYRDGLVRNAETGAAVAVRCEDPADELTWHAFEGRRMWVCWDPAKPRKCYPQRKRKGAKQQGPGKPYAVDTPAYLLLDDGWSARGIARFPLLPTPRDPAAVGTEVGGPQAPLDQARTVRAWNPHRTWPLTFTRSSYVLLSLALLASGLLFTDLVSGIPRLLLGLLGMTCLLTGSLRDVSRKPLF